MNNQRITAAARALCRHASAECGINQDDNWTQYSGMFIADAKVALKAADEVPDPRSQELINKLKKANALLEETIKHYRQKYGVTGQAATPENISA